MQCQAAEGYPAKQLCSTRVTGPAGIQPDFVVKAKWALKHAAGCLMHLSVPELNALHAEGLFRQIASKLKGLS